MGGPYEQMIGLVQQMLGELPGCPSEAVGAAVWDMFLASILQTGEWNESTSVIAATGVLTRTITVIRVSASCLCLRWCYVCWSHNATMSTRFTGRLTAVTGWRTQLCGWKCRSPATSPASYSNVHCSTTWCSDNGAGLPQARHCQRNIFILTHHSLRSN